MDAPRGAGLERQTAEDLWLEWHGKMPVVLHYHIYKNAGSTIDSILEREFGVFFAALHSNDANAIISNSELLSFLERQRTVLALTSHQIRYPKPVSEHFEFFDFCFIRHPLDRLFSQYGFLRKPSVDDPLAGLARTTDLAGFLGFLLDHHPEYACNAQTRLLLHQGDGSAISSDDFHPIRELLGNISLLGVVDAFDESLMVAEYSLHPYFPRLRLHYCPQNVTNSREMPFSHRLDLIRSSCGERLYGRLVEANRFDMELWRQARLELRCRLDARPQHEQWLREFRLRTERYQGGPRLRDRILQLVRIRAGQAPRQSARSGCHNS